MKLSLGNGHITEVFYMKFHKKNCQKALKI